VSKFKAGLSLLILIAVAGCNEQNTTSRSSGNTSVIPAESLQTAATDPRVKALYEAREWNSAWSAAQGKELEASLQDASRHGIDPQRFISLIRSADNVAEREASLTLAALAYAEALSQGLVDPGKIHEIYTVPRNTVDVVAGLNAALNADHVGDWLASLAPADAEYKALSNAYLRYKARAGTNQALTEIPTGTFIRIGDRDPRVALIAQRLRNAGYYEPPSLDDVEAPPAMPAASSSDTQAVAVPDSIALTRELSDAVKELQSAYGLKDDGVVGDDTIKLLNIGFADRARQLALNLERRRWLERAPAPTRIDVNTAATLIAFMADGKRLWSGKVVAGHHDTPTPNLGSNFHQLVVNPPWNVPKSIADEELLPKGAAYLRKHNMKMTDNGIVQEPGPDSALGLVKFDLDNKHAIYLHDTPAKTFFAQNERNLSHGCVRVENAVDFARLIAGHIGKAEEFDAGLASGKTKSIALPNKIPVRLLYHTAYVNDEGGLAFRPDIYGWDEDLAAELGFNKITRFASATVAAPLGP